MVRSAQASYLPLTPSFPCSLATRAVAVHGNVKLVFSDKDRLSDDKMCHLWFHPRYLWLSTQQTDAAAGTGPCVMEKGGGVGDAVSVCLCPCSRVVWMCPCGCARVDVACRVVLVPALSCNHAPTKLFADHHPHPDPYSNLHHLAVVFTKNEVDGAVKDKNHKHFAEDFTITLYFAPEGDAE